MKVLVLTTVMAPYRVQLFNELGKQCELTVCFEQKNDESRKENWYDKNITNFRAVHLKKWDKPLNKIKFDIIDVVNTSKPDIAIAYEYSTRTALIFMTYCRMKSIPYLINCDGGFISKSIKGIVKRHFIKNALAYLASGNMAKKYFMYYGADETSIYLHNFSSLRADDIISQEPSMDEKIATKQELGIEYRKNVVSVGQFIHRKGYDVLLDAAKKIDSSVGIYIIGGKPTEEYLEYKNKHKLDNVHFLDFMSKESIKKWFTVADVFTLPTREDVWGLVINESMACGLPVVTTDRCVAGLELIENGKNGYIVPIEDSQALAEKINLILSDEELRLTMSKNNLEKIREYTIENVAARHIEVLKELMERM